MKLRSLIAIAIVASIALMSCEKDDPATPPGTNPPGTPTQTKKLKKVTMTEAGVSKVFNLIYDNANRLKSFNTSADPEYVLFSYDAQGNLTGIEQKEAEFKNIYSYVYQNNKPVTGVYKSWELVAGQPDELIEDDRLTYTVTNNQVSAIRLEMLQTGIEMNLQLTYAGNNLVKVVGGGPFTYTADFSFGTRRSAFPKVSNYVLDQAGFSLQFACNNEMLTAAFDFPGTDLDRNVSTQYTYDSAGYVLTSNDGETQMTFEYQ